MILNSNSDNLEFVPSFFDNILSKRPSRTLIAVNARAEIARKRKKTVFEGLKNELDLPISDSEDKEAINALAWGKSLGLDGFPSEFYRTYADFLTLSHDYLFVSIKTRLSNSSMNEGTKIDWTTEYLLLVLNLFIKTLLFL